MEKRHRFPHICKKALLETFQIFYWIWRFAEKISMFARMIHPSCCDLFFESVWMSLPCKIKTRKNLFLLDYVSVRVSSVVKLKVKSLSRVRLFATPWTVAHQAPPSMGFSRQECWSGSPFPSPGNSVVRNNKKNTLCP